MSGFIAAAAPPRPREDNLLPLPSASPPRPAPPGAAPDRGPDLRSAAHDPAAAGAPASEGVAREAPAPGAPAARPFASRPAEGASVQAVAAAGAAGAGAPVPSPRPSAFPPAGEAGAPATAAFSTDPASAPAPAPTAPAAAPALIPAHAASAAVVTIGQVTALAEGLDPLLQAIQTALQTKAFLESLPVIGKLAGSGAAALTAFQTFEQNVSNALGALEGAGGDTTFAALQSALSSAAAGTGFSAAASQDAAGDIALTLGSGGSQTFSTPVDGRFGLPGLNFQTTGTADATLSYNLGVTADVSAAGAFSDSAPGAALSLGVTLSGVDLTADATLGFLRFTAQDVGSALSGTFDVDAAGNTTFAGGANVDVKLKTDLGTAALPSIGAELKTAWNFSNTAVDPTDPSAFGSVPAVTLDDVTYDFGSLVDNFLKPVLADLDAALQPLAPIVSLFDTNLTFLQTALGDNWHMLDVAGALGPTGNNIPDGKLTLLDFLALGGDNAAVAPLVKAVEAFNTIDAWNKFFSGQTEDSAGYSLGSFAVPGDIRAPGFMADTAVPTIISAAQSLSAALGGLSGSYDNVDPGTGQTAAQDLQNIVQGGGFSFPILTNPVDAAELLLGGPADLIDYQTPLTSFGFGAVNGDGVPTSVVPIAVLPIIPGVLSLQIGGALSGQLAFDFGFDTSGLAAFASGGYRDASLIARGIYVANPVVGGVMQPFLNFGGALQLAGVLGDAPVVSLSAGGDISGQLGVGLASKEYLYQIFPTLTGSDPLSLFEASGRVSAGLELELSALGQTIYTIASPRITLASFDTLTKSGPVWIGGPIGDLETAGNWSPGFETQKKLAGPVDYYGDAKINAGSTVVADGPTPADFASLAVSPTSEFLLQQGVVTIDGTTMPSVNSGTISATGGTLALDGSLVNIGTLSLVDPPAAPPAVEVNGLVIFSGGGAVEGEGAGVTWTVGSEDPGVSNVDNLFEGSGTFDVPVYNKGTFDATQTSPLVLAGPATNLGVFEATGATVGGVTADGTIELLGTVDDAGGLIQALRGGEVLIGSGATVYGGELLSDGAPSSAIVPDGDVSFEGGTLGLQLAADITLASGGSTLTLNGLLTGPAYSADPGAASVVANGGTILLQAATIVGGELDASAPGSLILVAKGGAATLDGSGGAPGLLLAGSLLAGAASTLTADGGLGAATGGAGVELAGATLLAGAGAHDGLTLTGPGLLRLDDGTGSDVTGTDAASALSNGWIIQGSGTLGAGRLLITNLAAGQILATGTKSLLVAADSAGPLVNDGLLGAQGGTLDLAAGVADAAGRITADSGVVLLDGDTVQGGTLASASGGSIAAVGTAELDGSALPVSLTAGLLLAGAAAQLSVKGSLVDQAVIGLAGAPTLGPAAFAASDAVRLSGGGTIDLGYDAGSATDGYQVVTGIGASGADSLENVDATITGLGLLGDVTYGELPSVGNRTLAYMNDGKAELLASGGTLTVQTNGPVANAGLIGALATGVLALDSDVENAGGTVAATGGTVELSSRIAGGAVASGAGGVVQSFDGTLDGTSGAVTIEAGSTVEVPAVGNDSLSLNLLGDIVNAGTVLVQATGAAQTLVVQGTVSLSGGGVVALVNETPQTLDIQPDSVIGMSAADTLVNSDDTITGSGQIGDDTLTLVNQAAGTIEARGGVLVLSPSGTLTNAGLLRAAGGTLDLDGAAFGGYGIQNAGGTLAAVGDGAGRSGVVDVNDVAIRGGLLTSQAGDPGSFFAIDDDRAQATELDGTAGAVTLAAGSQVTVEQNAFLTLAGTIADQGTISALSTLLVSGAVTLTGGGAVGLNLAGAPVSGDGFAGLHDAAADSLDNFDAISGNGDLGGGAMSLTNEGAGSITALNGEMLLQTIGAFVNRGVIGSGVGGTLVVASDVDNAGGTVVVNAGSVYLDGAVTGGAVTFAGAGLLALGSPATLGPAVGGFRNGDTIDFLSAPPSFAPKAELLAGNTLAVVTGGQTFEVRLDPSVDYAGATFTPSLPTSGVIGIDVTVDIPCFLAGTRLRTPSGETPVEHVREGDLLATLSGRLRPVRWVGSRRIDLARHPAPEDVSPILLRAGCLAPGVPLRDLRVSPDHALFLHGGLVPARLLVNGGSIVRETHHRELAWHHVELDAHDVVFADGAPAESFLDTGNRALFASARGAGRASRSQQARVARSCAKLLDDPASIEPVWRELAARAGAIGWPAGPVAPAGARDPRLRVRAGRRVFAPLHEHCGRYVFALPAVAGPIRLRSRAEAPSRLKPWVDDRRRLGVAVRRLTVTRGSDVVAMAADHPGLAEGWWAAEGGAGNLWRWTDGDAVLPLPFKGPCTLEVETLGGPS